MRNVAITLAVASTLGLSACSGLGDRDQKMLSGAAIGAGVGVGVGVVVVGGDCVCVCVCVGVGEYNCVLYIALIGYIVRW